MAKHMQEWRRRASARAGGILWLYLVILLAFSAPPAYGQFDILLSPQIVSLELRPGARSLVTFELTNQDKDKPVTVRLSTSDIYQGARGEYKLADTTMPYSCVDWLELLDTLIEVPPGEMRQVAAGVEVPRRAMGGGYGAVVFEIIPQRPRVTDEDAMAASFEYRFQIPSWFEIIVKRSRGARRRLLPGEIEITPTAEDSKLKERFGNRGMAVSVGVENTGNVHVMTQGRVIIRDSNRRLFRDARLGGGRGLVLPGAKTQLRTIMPLPPPGQYTIKTFVDYGGRSPAISKSTFEISSEQASRMGETETARPLFLELRPDRYETSIPAGGFRTFGINVMNREDVPVEVDVSLGQFHYGPWGHMWVTDEEADTGRSCLSWLTIEPQQFTLDPHRAQNIRLTLAIDAEAKGGYYGCVILNAHSDVDTSAGTLPTPLYLPLYVTVPPDLEKGGEIVKVEVQHPRASAVILNTEFLNTGNIHEIISGGAEIQFWKEPEKIGSLEVLDTARFVNLVALKLEVDTTFVLPGQTRIIPSPTVDGLVPGRYKAKVEIRFGTKEPATMEKEFDISARENEY